MLRFRQFVLLVSAALAGYISYNALNSPGDVLAEFDILALTADARNEIRAQYGGFFLVVALTLLASLFNLLKARTGLFIILITAGGVLTGRLLSLYFEGIEVWDSYSQTVQAFFLIDGLLVLFALIGLLGSRRSA